MWNLGEGKKIVVTSEKVHDVKMVGNDVKKLETPVKRLPVKRLPARLAGLLTADGRDRWRPWREDAMRCGGSRGGSGGCKRREFT